ncbi:hypothetical protein [Pseudodesulfovibrio nedwellii]|nr:hypothetical protein [Pseudodesulfovibrio nedwellii]
MKKKQVDTLILFAGIATMAFGYFVYSSTTFCHYFGSYCTEMEPFHVEAGIGIAIIGVFMFIMAFRKDQRDYAEVFICPKCETALPFAEVPNEICPKCQTELEPLEGFYERHPELKDK